MNSHQRTVLVGLAIATMVSGGLQPAHAQWVTDGVPLSARPDANQQVQVTLVDDGSFGAIAAWRDERGAATPRGGIYAQRWNATGVPQWNAGGVALTSSSYDVLDPVIVPDFSGGAIITWDVDRGATGFDIYAQRVNASGVPQWGTDGVAVCNAALRQANPQLISDGSGGAIVTWEDRRNDFPSSDIYAQRLDASGATQWMTNGVALCAARGDQRGPKIVSDGAGGAIVAWLDGRGDIYAQRVNASGVPQWAVDGIALSAESPVGELTAVSNFAGGAIFAWEVGGYNIHAQMVNATGVPQWTSGGVVLCPDNFNFQQTSPKIVSDGASGAIVTWDDHRGTDADIYAQRVDASGVRKWTTDGVPLCTAPGDQTNATAVWDLAGGAIVTWEDVRGGALTDIYAQRVNAAGVPQWTSDGVALCTAPHTQFAPAIVTFGVGGAIVAWVDDRALTGSDIYSQRMSSSGVPQWASNGVGVGLFPTEEHPAIISDGAGGSIVAWEDHRFADYDIYAQRVNANGVVQWATDGITVCAAPGDQLSPVIVSDGAGGAIVAWNDHRSSTHIYSQHITAAGANSNWGDVNGLILETTQAGQPAIATDGAGGAIVTWSDLRNEPTAGDIYAQRVNGSGARQWGTDGLPVCLAGSLQQSPTIMSDGANGVIVSWWDYRAGLDVYAQRLNASGSRLWNVPDNNGVPVCTAPGDQRLPVITSDGAQGAIIAWDDQRSSSHIYAQHITAAGVNSNWGDVNGLILETTQAGQPAIASDGAGGAIVTWSDQRNEPVYGDIYAQRVNVTGARQWGTDGLPVCLAGSLQQSPTIVSDGSNGAIISWWDYRAGLDVYAQRLSASGSRLWTVPDNNGVPVCTAADDQRNLAMTANPGGGASLTWNDLRGDKHGVYAQRLLSGGTLAVTPAPVEILAPARAWPNPFSNQVSMEFGVQTETPIRVDVFDVTGRRVRTVSMKLLSPGRHTLIWDGRDDQGTVLGAGIYLLHARGLGIDVSRAVVRMK